MVSLGEFRYLITLHEQDEQPYTEEITSQNERDFWKDESSTLYQEAENRTNEKPKSKGKKGEDKDEKSKREESKSRAGHDKNDSRIKEAAEAKIVTPCHREEQKVHYLKAKSRAPSSSTNSSSTSLEVIKNHNLKVEEKSNQVESRKVEHEATLTTQYHKQEETSFQIENRKPSAKLGALAGAQSPKAEESKTTDNIENRTSLRVHHGSVTTSGVEAEEDSNSFKTKFKAEVKTEKVEQTEAQRKRNR
ncbi:hypothetical protein R1sor_017912 [Riccia sorocarpa]|uniref:Uncharacterized protein n=1 Tax=Riccia sorocarpa TaxID=122646 RepID=A0ABD3IBX0_9MARC